MSDPRKHTICLTFDFDALSVWLGDRPNPTPAMLSRGEYGARVGVPRILELLEEYEIEATFFVPGHTVDSFPKEIETILAAGHELGHHGYGHEPPGSQTAEEERKSLEKGLESLARFLDRPPLGYRSPSWDYSANTLGLLVEYGFLYDSSLFADDFYPYHPRIGDKVSANHPLERGTEVQLWEFPVHFSLDDWPHFSFSFDSPGGLATPSKVFEIWREEFDYMIDRAPGGVFTLTSHPQVIGRGHRMVLLERFIEHTLASGPIRFARMGDLAQELEQAKP